LWGCCSGGGRPGRARRRWSRGGGGAARVDGGAPAGLGRRGPVGELQWRVGKLLRGSAWTEGVGVVLSTASRGGGGGGSAGGGAPVALGGVGWVGELR
jgi:hypothetical protein